jgi:hypothetical protein
MVKENGRLSWPAATTEFGVTHSQHRNGKPWHDTRTGPAPDAYAHGTQYSHWMV